MRRHPHAQALLSKVVKGDGFDFLVLRVRLRGHWHSVNKTGQHGVVDREILPRGLDGRMAADILGARMMVDIDAGLRIARHFLYRSVTENFFFK